MEQPQSALRPPTGLTPTNSPLPGHLRARDDIPPLPRPESIGIRPQAPLQHASSGSQLAELGEAAPQTFQFSHQRVNSGGSRASGGGRRFSHQRELSGSSTASGVHKSIVTPRHISSRTMAGYYDVVGELGKGSFGVVRLVSDRATTQERVCKTVSTSELAPGLLDMVRNEVELLKSLDHPHVVKLFEYVEDTDRQELVLILEYVPGGSCAELLKKSMFSLVEALVSRLIYQVLAAVAYCHAQGVAHRDVKPEHMMLTQVGLWGHPNCKLIDFGLAAFTASASSQDFVGTPEYMAPEVIDRATGDATKTDIWSIGISTIELLTGKSPFGKPLEYGSNDPVYANVRRYSSFRDIEGTLDDLRGWSMRSDEARDFAYWLLVKDPTARPTAAEAIMHPWMEQHREKRASLTREMIRSMNGYIQAHPLVRCCLLVVAARTEVQNRERLEAGFLWLDSDCDGEISSQDLAGALAKPAEWWDTADLLSVLRGSPEFDPVELIEAADLDQSGGLSFTEFVATCLYQKQDSTDGLVRRAFEALDDDRDGLVHANDVFTLFQELDFSSYALLPQDKPISMTEWCALFNEAFTQPTYQRKVVVRKKKRGWC